MPGWVARSDGLIPSGLAFGFVHNRLLSPFVVVDHAGFVATGAMLRRGAAEARKHGFERLADFGSPFPEPGAVAWLTDLLSVLEPEADL